MKRRHVLALGGTAIFSVGSGCLSQDDELRRDTESTPEEESNRTQKSALELPSPEHDGWPMAGYDAGNTGHHRTASLPSTEPEQQWTKTLKEIDEDTTPLVSSQQVHVGSTTPRGSLAYLYQLNTTTGDEARTTSLGSRSNGPTPAIADGTIYINTRPSTGTIAVAAIDTSDGTQQWEFELDDRLKAPLVVAGDSLYLTTDSQLIALGREDGVERWRKDVSQRFQPAVGNGAIHIMFEDSIYAYNWQSGKQQWKYELTERGSLTPAVRHGRVYAGDGTDVIALEDGEEVWRAGVKDLGLHEHELVVEVGIDPNKLPLLGRTLAVDDSQVYVGRAGFLHALDAETGAGKWTTTIPQMDAADNRLRAPLTVADSTLLVPLPHVIGGVDTTDGSIQWTVEGPRAPAGRFAISGGQLFAVGWDGDLYAYGNTSDN